VKTDGQATPAGAEGATPVAERRSASREIAEAIDLGWRVAALHSLRPPATASQAAEDMLLNRRSLSAADRFELELRAITGVAQRIGVGLGDAELSALLALAGAAAASPAGEQAFRDALARQHISFAKQLWAAHEPSGKAYELGNFLSDSWNRALRPRAASDPIGELHEIFSVVRVERIKLLLDDLQTRVDPVAALAVSTHLDDWHKHVRDTAIPADRSLEPLERQTIVWRQMLTGDKEPEAYIGRVERVAVRKEFTDQIWKRNRRRLYVLAPLLVGLGAGLAVLYDDNEALVRGVAGGALALAGTFGFTRASMIGTLRRGLESWGDLMWNRALATVICRKTSMLAEFCPPAGDAPQRTNSTSTASPAASDARSSGTNA